MGRQNVKRTGLILLLCLVVLGVGTLIAQSVDQTQETIIIKTPGKKSGGTPTHVRFYHAKHVKDFSAQCDMCHPDIVPQLNAPGNSQKNVHKTCRQCHAKNKPGKNFICARCHRK